MKLDSIFNPRTIAVIGATDRIGSVGRGLVKNLLEDLPAKISKKNLGRQERKIYLINPNRDRVFGIKTLSRISDIKEKIDLVIIAVPAKIVPEVVEESCDKKVGGIIVISSGFSETGPAGLELQNKIKKITLENKIPLVGPNCLGIIRPTKNLNASFAPSSPAKGETALISQSGALLDSIIDASAEKSYGFSAIISYGNQAGVSLSDFLKWAGEDPETKVIALYIEGLKNGRKFFEVAKEISRKKPIVVLKGGKTPGSKKAVSSHTGSLAGSAQIYSTAFKQAGLIEVQSLQELLDVSKALSWQPRCKNGIGIITNGGGAGILTTDYCYELRIKLSKLSPRTINNISRDKSTHPGWSKHNPIDIVGDALSDRYQTAIQNTLKQKDIHGLIIIQTLQIMTQPIKNAKIIIEFKKRYPQKPIVAVFMGGKKTNPSIKLLEKNRIPTFSDPRRASLAMKALILS